MHITAQKEKVAQQIANAQQAKLARQNLFNSTVRTTQNALQTFMGLGTATSSFLNQQQAYSQMASNRLAMANALNSISIDKGQLSINPETLKDENLKQALEKDGYIKDGKFVSGTTRTQAESAISAYYTQQMSDFTNAQITNSIVASAGQMAMQGIINAGTYFQNMHNSVTDFTDSIDLEQLNNLDSQLEQEKTSIETQLAALKEEEEAVQKAQEAEIKKSAPKFSA